MLRSLSATIRGRPEFEPVWKSANVDTIIANPRFGMVMHVVVCRPDGSPIYDQPAWAEPQGAICIPIKPSGEIVLIENERAIPFRVRPDSFPPDSLVNAGRTSLELPRGFPNSGETAELAAAREVQEETGYSVEMMEYIDETNSNTTYYLTSIQIFVARLGKQLDHHEVDEHEQISRVIELTPEEAWNRIANAQIFCGITKSALMSYFARRFNGASLRERAND